MGEQVLFVMDTMEIIILSWLMLLYLFQNHSYTTGNKSSSREIIEFA